MSSPDIASRFDEIYNSTSRDVLIFVTAKCKYTADICDIVQETYMELYNVIKKRGANYITDEKAFVLKIARQKLSRYYSLMERLRIFSPLVTTNEGGEHIDLSETVADDFLTEEFAVNQVMLDAVKELLIQKPEAVKKVFYLYYDVGLTITEIAQTLSQTESNVKNKLYRTINDFRKILNE